jgi:NADPH:quinone reductase-like Zn-dependent oxidoreductase
MRTLRFYTYGEPAEVLRLERTDIPSPGVGRIRVAVYACGLTPADWALCRGLFPGALPRGIGLEVAGIVDAVGEDVTDVAAGDRIVGAPDYVGAPVAGASDFAILNHWARIPAHLEFSQAAALPMAVETAYRSLDQLGVRAGQRLLVHGAGTTVGFAAVQMGLLRGARVVATAGDTYAQRLRAMGADVTTYGDGLAERVLKITEGPVDLALDTAPVNVTRDVKGALPDLVRVVGGDPRRVLTVVDFEGAARLGVRTGVEESTEANATPALRYDVLGEFAQMTADQQFSVPIAQTFALEDWRSALQISQSGHARGKLLLMPRNRHD